LSRTWSIANIFLRQYFFTPEIFFTPKYWPIKIFDAKSCFGVKKIWRKKILAEKISPKIYHTTVFVTQRTDPPKKRRPS